MTSSPVDSERTGHLPRPPAGPAGQHSLAGDRLATSRQRGDWARAQARASLRRDPVLRWATVVATTWVAAYAVAQQAVRGSSSAAAVLGELVYLVPIAGAAALSLVVAASGRRPRPFWWLLAASNLLWILGDVLWAGYVFVLRTEAPWPSVADAAYLGSYALVPVAVVLGFRSSGSLASARGVLDAAIIALSLGFAGWQVLVAPQLGETVDLGVVTGAAYPLLGVVIIVTLVAISTSAHRSVPAPVLGIAVAFAVSGVTDAGYTWFAVLNSYVEGSWFDLGWQLGAVIMCVALLMALRHEETDQDLPLRGRDVTLLPVVGSVALLLALLVWDLHDGQAQRAGVLVALLAMSILLLRFGLTLTDLRRATGRLDDALQEQERLAVTDGLTGLYNRRFITELMTIETDRARRSSTPISLLALDIDHFKRVNDGFGHHAGDQVLVEVSRRIAATVRADDVLARSGGEEFLVLAQGTHAEEAREVAERVRLAVKASPVWCGDQRAVEVTVSIGYATMRPEDSGDAFARRADQALYAAKAAGRDQVLAEGDVERAVGAVTDPAVLALLERVADVVDGRVGPDGHSWAVARFAEQLCRRVGLDEESTAHTVLAARLHDIGKIDVPEELLVKVDPLTPQDRRVIRRHPGAGADMLEGLTPPPVGDLVRAHHERYDGTGYPHGLAGDAIPLGARVISVANAYAAMTARRHHAGALDRSAAHEELRRGAGTRFDPRVVDAFLQLVQDGAVDPVHALPVRRGAVVRPTADQRGAARTAATT